MRPVDADVEISLIQKDKIEGKPLDIIKALGDGLQAETLNMACDRHIKIIKSLPTVEAEPTKHGHWINIYGWVHCSVCHQEPPNESNIESDYCPNCGARMDEMTE